MWSLSEFAIQVEILWSVVIWTHMDNQFSVVFWTVFRFCKGNLFNYLSRSVSFHVKIRQIWLAVSCIVCVFGGGVAPGNTTEKPEISLRYIPVWSSGDAEAVEELIDGRWCWVHVWGGASVERCFFFHGWNRKRLQGGCWKSHMFRFFLFSFGTFLLAKNRVCFVCIVYIMSICVVWFCLIKLGLYSLI